MSQKRAAEDDSGPADAKRVALSLLPTNHGAFTHTGRKEHNEDRYVCDEDMGALGTFYAVYDGHGGESCAEYLVKHLAKTVRGVFSHRYGEDLLGHSPAPPSAQQLEAHGQLTECIEGRTTVAASLVEEEPSVVAEALGDMLQLEAILEDQLDEIGTADNSDTNQIVQRSLGEAYIKTDKAFLAKTDSPSGSTCLSVLVRGGHASNATLYVANTGDSRAVLCRGRTAYALSEDHKPSRRDEMRRIKEAGGFVVTISGVDRVTTPAGAGKLSLTTGSSTYLAVSRAFGDRGLKARYDACCSVSHCCRSRKPSYHVPPTL